MVKSFEGPVCRKLLKSSDFLQSAEFLKDLENPLTIVPLSSTFLAFNKLVHACFGANQLQKDLDKLLDNFVKSYKALNSSVTLKVHIVFEHLIPGLANLNGRGLGIVSEQAGESIHHEFDHHFWARYKINSMSNPRFSNNWYNANLEFCSKHV